MGASRVINIADYIEQLGAMFLQLYASREALINVLMENDERLLHTLLALLEIGRS